MANNISTMKDSTMTDILVICKGWYNKLEYKDILDALSAYYHKNYGNESIVMDRPLATHLFLKPLALKAIEIKPTLARYILEPSFSMTENDESFTNVLYDRLLNLIQMIPHGTFNLSEYEEMFEKAKDCNYLDDTIGII